MQVTATLTLNARPSEREQAEIQKRLGSVLADYFGTLKVGEAVREAKIRALLLGHDAVVGCERSGQRPLLEPFARNGDGALESIAFRALMGSGDLMTRPGERLFLDPKTLPLRLSLESPLEDLWIDIHLSLSGAPTGNDFEARVMGAIKDLFDKAARSATTEAPARVRYTDLHGAISRLIVNIHIVRLRVTVTHTRDGLVEELDGEDGEATIGPREQAIPRKPRLRIEGGDG